MRQSNITTDCQIVQNKLITNIFLFQIGLNDINPEYSSRDDYSDEENLYGDYSRYLESDEMARDAEYIGMEITAEDEEMFDKFHNPCSKEATEEIK